jgi:hypothetical protein
MAGVRSDESVGALLAEALQQLSHGAGNEAQRTGNEARALTLFSPLNDHLTHGHRKRMWHERSSLQVVQGAVADPCIPCLPPCQARGEWAAKPGVGIRRQNLVSGDTFPWNRSGRATGPRSDGIARSGYFKDASCLAGRATSYGSPRAFQRNINLARIRPSHVGGHSNASLRHLGNPVRRPIYGSGSPRRGRASKWGSWDRHRAGMEPWVETLTFGHASPLGYYPPPNSRWSSPLRGLASGPASSCRKPPPA